MGMATYDEFSHQGGIGKGKSQSEINQEEGRSPVTRRLRGETPDIAEADGTAGGSHDKTEPGTEFSTGGCHETPNRYSLLSRQSTMKWWVLLQTAAGKSVQ